MEASSSSDDEVSTIGDAVLVKESLDFSSPWHFSDVVLVVGDTNLHVHKCILSMWSPVFRTMFSSHFLEGAAKEIPLPGKHADEMEVLLKFIYSSGTNPEVTDENYHFLLELAEEYQMDRVKSMCSKFLVNEIEVSNSLEFFKIAEKFGLVDVTDKCYQEVRYNSSADLKGSEHFNGFEPELKVDICMRVIKELERTLEEYVRTCSDLVQKVYKKVYEKCYRDISHVSFSESERSFGFSTSGALFGSSNAAQSVKMYSNTQKYENLSEHIKVHVGLQNQLETALTKGKVSGGDSSLNPKDYNTKCFEFACSLCLKQVQAIPWKNSDSYNILKQPVNKLYALQQNNKVARKAKKRADKVFSVGVPLKGFGSVN